MRLVRAGTEAADRKQSGGGMSMRNLFIREGREVSRRKPKGIRLYASGAEFAFTSRRFAPFADKDL
jgi:hypothetical protein